MNTFADEPIEDEIIAEVRSIREALAARYDYDLTQLFEEAKQREKSSDRVHMKASPKRLTSTPST
jgi:hypothetical protein